MNWFAARLKEPSTWRGLIWLLTACGISLSPEAWQYIATAGMALAGLAGVLTSEQPTRVDIQLPAIELVGSATAPAPDDRLRDAGVPSGTSLPPDFFHDSFGG
ncbi:hypothetical protein [Candidatus Contendibacter odensensis]|uniref:Uncharacterized protein n=1 Tax=Candidatus Contendobacter odensis Run_B_J11 TaxID=1400861 RepID=A0A7U7G983_9GAMM|nr:hypothetical protein [Candidatus Contendobacter odensis]CDH43844.1 exported hypothetical protein [Candidatus Contendobacter odensis Run_B_J11]